MADAQIAVDYQGVVVIANEMTIYTVFQIIVVFCHVDGEVVAILISLLRFHIRHWELFGE